MKEGEWNDALNHLDLQLVEAFVVEKERRRQKKTRRRLWLRLGAMAACLCFVSSVLLLLPFLQRGKPAPLPKPDDTTVWGQPGSDPSEVNTGDTTLPETEQDGELPEKPVRPNLPLVSVGSPSSAPIYHGSAASEGSSVGFPEERLSSGLAVTAELLEAHPDTYTFFNDWMQKEFCLLKMRTVTLLKGQEMSDEFYYLIPVGFMTDYSIFDRFVLMNMEQYAYEYAIVYNQTKGQAERLDLVLFGYCRDTFDYTADDFMAFDADGNFDSRLWQSTEQWISFTNTHEAQTVDTIQQAEERARQGLGDTLYVHSLKDITGDAAQVLSHITSLENGVYVPRLSSMYLYLGPEVQFHTVRYINGFATNEAVSVWCKEWTHGDTDTYAWTKARFSAEDLTALPDLASAVATVAAAYDAGTITPPHLADNPFRAVADYGIFGWYAQTSHGVMGIVRVTWRMTSGALDDAYYIVEYGADVCTPIDRDALLERIGAYETTYIYLGDYDEHGKKPPETPAE